MTAALLLGALVAAAHAAPVSGQVRERGTGDPVVGATVVGPSGATLATSGPRGGFTVDLPDGPTTLQVLASTHLPATVVVTLAPGAPAPPVRLFLEPAPPTPEVVVEARRESAHAAERVLDRERVEKTPGTHDDLVRLIQALPGVATTPEYGPASGDLAIRGAAPDESTVLLDGIELPYLYHFQQYSSVLHTRLLDELALTPSAYGPSYGGALGGIAAVSSRRPDPQQLHGGFNLNAIMAGGFIQAPVADGWAVSASARRSYADLYEDSNDQYTAWPVFWDYQARVDRRASDRDRLALSVLGAGDAYGRYAGDTEALDPVEQAENPAFSSARAFHGGILRWERDTDRATLRTSLGVVADAQDAAVGDDQQRRDERSVEGRHNAVLSLTDAWRLALGGDARFAQVDRLAQPSRAWVELGAEAPLLARGVTVDESLSRIEGGIYAEPRWERGALDLRPGVRLQADSRVGAVAPEPRLGARLRATEAVRLRAAAGRYTQAPSLDALSPQSGDPTLGLSDSWQGAAGVDLLVSGRWEISVDGWGRRLTDAVFEPPGEAPEAQDGVAWGGELVSRYRVRERFFSWVGLTLGRSLRDGAPGPYDQPWSVTAVASWDFRPRWNAGVRYRAASGLPYTPITGGTYDGDTDTYAPIVGTAWGARLPTYQKLDVHLDRAFAFRQWTLHAYLEAWWVPPKANNLYPVYSYDFSEQALVAGPGFVPLLGVRAAL